MFFARLIIYDQLVRFWRNGLLWTFLFLKHSAKFYLYNGHQNFFGHCNRHKHAKNSHLQSASSTLRTTLICRIMVLRHSLHTKRLLTQLFPYATCVKLCHVSVRLIQLWPICMGCPWFRAIHLGTLQLQIENWNVRISIWPCGLSAFMLNNGLNMWDFAHVPYMCSIVSTTFGFWAPSFWMYL